MIETPIFVFVDPVVRSNVAMAVTKKAISLANAKTKMRKLNL